MPWKTRNALDQRNEFITAWLRREETLAELCRRYEISRKTGYKWLERFEEGGRCGLEDRNRAPLHSPQAIGRADAMAIIGARERYPNWGARKIRLWLQRQKPGREWPAASSIGELLKREGLIQGRRVRRKSPPYSGPLEHAGAPNDLWCVDFKGWFRCGDGTRCDPFTNSDACSRLVLCCRAVEKTDGPHVRRVMEATFRAKGLPQGIRSDNGPPFASRAPGGLTRLSMWWLRLGIRHERIDPGCPEQNGRHERMHRTLKQETANPPAANLRQQQEVFARFERMYNEERPHEALGGKTPAQVYVASTRVYPSRLPELEYPAGTHLRRISQQGSLKWRCERTFLSEVLAREIVGLLETEEEFFEVYYGPLLIGWLDGRSHVFAPERPRSKRRRKQEKA
ncbi:MAG TPA: IS481 family transposase [Candidatus Acidoferrum sp.]|nr:IS481 family transposase [Candidatus Acidoferrum sp.]